MPTIRVEQESAVSIINCEEGANLLKALQGNGFEIYSPCGGMGTCGKCKVHLKGLGPLNSCRYTVTGNIEVVLPAKREAVVLVDQHEYTTPVSLDPGDFSELSVSPHGVAIDIGTTTLALHFVNLTTGTLQATRPVVNPQTKYGADVISRINFTAQNEGGLQLLQKEIVDSINEQLKFFVEFADIRLSDIVKITITGNTTMLHILLGVDPLPIALVPFKPAFTDQQVLSGQDLGLHCNPRARVITLPSVAAYVGADITAGIASIKPPEKSGNYLFIDIGTNGEMALITPSEIWCCSTAAGPAFEGANISCGMSAVEGAISSYEYKGYFVIGNTQPQGLCGSGLVDVVAFLIKNNIINHEGSLEEDFEIASSTKDNPAVKLTQQDIRELQLAKAAIMAGIKGLLRKASLEAEQLDGLFLAGGFGNYIDVSNAIKIGMLPPEMKDKTIPLGNTSATGALLSLLSTGFDNNINDVLNRAVHFELSEDDDFMLDFVMNMSFGG